jgi:hypothetical protein
MTVSYPDLPHASQPYRAGEGDQTSSVSAPTGAGKLWLPIWSGEVIHAYDEYNKFENMVSSKTIASGASMQFPITGTVDIQAAWKAGEELSGGQNSKSTTFNVSLDKRPIAAFFETDNIDLMITQWEYRAELARQAGLALANARDKQIWSFLVRCGATNQLGSTADPRPQMGTDDVIYGGTTASNAEHLGTGTVIADRQAAALELLESIEKFLVHLQENNIDAGQVYCAVTPQAFMDIRSLGVARQTSELAGGGNQLMFNGSAEGGFGYGLGGSFTQGMAKLQDTLVYMGVTICKSNHIVTADESGEDSCSFGEDRYGLDFDAGAVRSCIWTPECVASLKLQGVKVDTVDDIRRNTQFTVASTMNGTGILRPECCALFTGYTETGAPTRDACATALDVTNAGGDEYVVV